MSDNHRKTGLLEEIDEDRLIHLETMNDDDLYNYCMDCASGCTCIFCRELKARTEDNGDE